MQEIIEVVESYNGYIKNVTPGSLKIASLLREGEISEAIQSILHFSEGMDWLIEVTSLLDQQSVKTTLSLDSINEFLVEINNGLQSEDYVLVADMFEYEIAPFFETVTKIELLEQ